METITNHNNILVRLLHVPVLTYHKIDVRRELGLNSISPSRFRKQIEFLSRAGYQGITFKEVLYSQNLPEKSVIITFDDGYESVFKYAYPVLKEYGFRAVVYVISGFVGQWNSWDIRPGGVKFRHLDESQIKALLSAGWEIGAHGVTHRALTSLSSKELEREIFLCKTQLSELCGNSIDTIAYPFGLHNPMVHQVVKAAGFQLGCGSIRNLNGSLSAFQIPRIPVYWGEGKRAFCQKLKGLNIPKHERVKLLTLSLPSVVTPIYQKLFCKQLFVDCQTE
ncbi:MAG: hypothetical protein D6732_11730 [Methanobacteriota archaeon]|nr:MAG: hypothetical protein D6732_11730 [Euryarchaeota archaeon]